MKRKIYISIPISGERGGSEEVCKLKEQKAKEKADLLKAKLSREGYIVVSPFDVYCGKHPRYEDYICYDLRAMLDCDIVYFCEGWEHSLGCSVEHDVVMRFKSKVHDRNVKDYEIRYE